VVLVLLDFSKAFDSVDHDRLPHLCFITSHMTERSQCVSAGWILPDFSPALSGVLQGSVSILIFTRFIAGQLTMESFLMAKKNTGYDYVQGSR
jgi:hypothetical protein